MCSSDLVCDSAPPFKAESHEASARQLRCLDKKPGKWGREGKMSFISTMACNFAAEAQAKFPAPNPPAPDNYSPGGYTRTMGEYEAACDAVLVE